MTRRPAAALLALLTLLVAAPVALAHQGNPNYRSVVKSVTPHTTGLDVEILNFDDRLLLHNTSGKDVVILDYEKTAVRADARRTGRSQVNTNSEAYYLNEDRQGETAVPKDLPAPSRQWKEVSKSGALRVARPPHALDGRGRPAEPDGQGQRDRDLRQLGRSRSQVGGAKGEIAGTLTWVPLDERRPADRRDLRLRRAHHRALDRGLHRPPPARGGGDGTPGAQDARSPWRRGEAGASRSLLALVAGLVAPASAFAHATLQSTIPERGAQLDAAPAEVVFRFDEAVEASFGALRVFDADGQRGPDRRGLPPRRPQARRSRSSSSPASATAPTRRPTASSPPTATRSRAASSSPSARAPRPPSRSTSCSPAGGTGPVTNTALGRRARRPVRRDRARPRRADLLPRLLAPAGVVSRAVHRAGSSGILLVAAIAGFVSACVAVILQGAVGQGGTFWAAARPDVVRRGARHPLRPRLGHRRRAPGSSCSPCSRTRPLRARGEPRPPRRRREPAPCVAGGGAVADRRGAAPAPALAATRARARPRASSRALAVPLFALALLPSLGGHTSVQKPVAMLLPANVLHVLAMAAWLGGIAVLVFALRAATAELAPEQRTPLLGDRRRALLDARRARAGRCCILTGVVQAIIEVGSFAALLDTPFGRSVLIKIVVAIAIVALGASTGRSSCRRSSAATGSRPATTGVLLRRTLRRELALGAIALAATGALSSYAPSTAEATGARSRRPSTSARRASRSRSTPPRSARTRLHLYLFDRKTGAPFEGTEELRVTAAMPAKKIAKIALEPHVAGPGHYVVERGDPRRGGRLDDRGDRARLGLRRVRAGASPSRSRAS